MDEEDLENFKEAFVKISDENEDTITESVDDREKLLEEYQQEASQLVQDNAALKLENTILSNSTGRVQESIMDATENSSYSIVQEAERYEQQDNIDNKDDNDDLSSIFSENEEELRSIVEGNATIKRALKNLRKERDFWIMDTASETSDDGDTSVSARSLRDASIDKIQISKLMADKEYLELKLSQVTNEKNETETKLKYLAKESGAKKYKESPESKISIVNDPESLQSHLSGINIRPSREDHQSIGDKDRERSNPHSHRHKAKHHYVKAGISDDELMKFLKSRSISPQLVKGYENDIALLAEENEKLGEIIDHLHINPDNEQTPMLDPMDSFMDALENRIPKEDYLRLENEKTKLEYVLREKERQIKERDRTIEESKFEYEEELKMQKEALKRMEEKMRDKAREASEYEIQIFELKTCFGDQLADLENELSMENEQRIRIEEINVGLADSSKNFQKEIEDLKNTVARLRARESELEKRYGHDLKMLEEKLLNENREKMNLSGNLEGLMSDLMMLKNKLLEESDKTGKMRQEFEKERLALGGGPSPRSPKIGKLAIGVNLGSRAKLESDDQTEAVPRSVTIDEMESFSSSLQKPEEFQKVEVSKYEAIIEKQKKNIESLEKVIQELKSKQQEKYSADEGRIHEDQIKGEMDINNTSSQLTSALKHKIEELEQENLYLKQRMEDLGKEKTKRRELEDKNEELQEEISKTARKRNDLQRKQESMNNEIEEMNEKVEELERSNGRLTKEADRLTNKIKEMEESFNEEKARLTLSIEKQKELSEKELNRALENEQERYKETKIEIENTRNEVSSLTAQIKDMEHRHSEELAKRDSDVEKGRERANQLQEKIQMYEEKLKRLNEEQRRSGIPVGTPSQDQSFRERRASFDNLQSSPRRDFENLAKKPEDIHISRERANYVEREMCLDENSPEYRNESLSSSGKVFIENKPNHERTKSDNGIEFEYTSKMPDLQIQVELEDKTEYGKSERHDQISRSERTHDKQRINKLEEEKSELRIIVNQKQNEIQNLSERLKQIEQQLLTKEKEMALLAEKERKAKNILEDNSKYYQGLLEQLKEKLQNEKKELEERLSKESEEMQQTMKKEFEKNLSSKSAILENKIHDLVAEKVRIHKDEVQRLEVLLQNERDKLADFEKSQNDTTKRLEREKKLLRVTIDALTKELKKAKQDRKDVKKEYKKVKAGMQKASEEEKRAFNETLEKAKEVQKLKIEEELRTKYKIDVEKYEEKLEAMNDEIHEYENRMEEMVIKFKEEKIKLENDLQDALLESENVKENQKEFKISMEEEYRRKLRKEKENIESTLETLRQEITRLREHRMQLESQLQQHAQYQHSKDTGHNTTQAHNTEIMLNNKEIFVRIEQEYQNQLQKEKEYFENKISETEKDYESLSEEMSSLKIKYRQDRISMKMEFEKERREQEERYEREKRDLQESMQMRIQGLREPRMTQPAGRSANGSMLQQRNRRLQSEVDVLQDKISRLKGLSSSFYGDTTTSTTVRSSTHSSTMGRSPNLYQNDRAKEQMLQSSNRGALNTQYSEMYVNNQATLQQDRPVNLQQQPVSNSSMMRNDVPIEVRESSIPNPDHSIGGATAVQFSLTDQDSSSFTESQRAQHYDISINSGMVETSHDQGSIDVTPSLDHQTGRLS